MLKFIIIFLFLASCASREEVLYLQDASQKAKGTINYQASFIQPNDILKINIYSSNPLSTIPYNRGLSQGTMQSNDIETMKIDGYIVDFNYSINFPVLGVIDTRNMTTLKLANHIKVKLIEGGHLTDPNVNVRLLNSKITILGEVNKPGTYNFTEQNITLLQALGYAGDLTINGKRDDVLIMREVNGIRRVTHIDLTSADFMKGSYYLLKSNDVIIVNPNNPKVKSAGFIGNVGSLATIVSLVLSVTILLTR